MTQPLSPAAQAIWEAYERADCDLYRIDPRRAGLAAALRAAAGILREAYANEEPMDPADDWLDDIAAELEGE